jgi:hypothetical protein
MKTTFHIAILVICVAIGACAQGSDGRAGGHWLDKRQRARQDGDMGAAVPDSQGIEDGNGAGWLRCNCGAAAKIDFIRILPEIVILRNWLISQLAGNSESGNIVITAHIFCPLV